MANNKTSNRPVATKVATLTVVNTAASTGANAASAVKAAVTGGIHIFNGTGVPGSVGQVSGDLFFRTDTPSVANQRLYTWNGTAWVAIL